MRADVARTTMFNFGVPRQWSARRRARAFHALPRLHAADSPRDELSTIMREFALISATSRRETTALIATGYFAILRAWIGSGRPPFDLEHRVLELVDLVLAGAVGRSGS